MNAAEKGLHQKRNWNCVFLYLDEEIEMQLKLLNWITSPRFREIIDKYSRMNACNTHPGLARAANESNRQNCTLIYSGHIALWFIGERRTNGGTTRREQERKKRQSRSQHARTASWSHPSKPNKRLREGEVWKHDNAISEKLQLKRANFAMLCWDARQCIKT